MGWGKTNILVQVLLFGGKMARKSSMFTFFEIFFCVSLDENVLDLEKEIRERKETLLHPFTTLLPQYMVS